MGAGLDLAGGSVSRSRLYLASGLLGALFAVFATWLISGWGGAATVTLVSDLGSLLAGGFAITSAGLTARASHGRQRWAWGALTVGLIGWFCGDAIWAFYDLVLLADTAPFPSAADAGYLLFSFATCVALILLPIGGIGQSQTRLLLDGAIVAASLFVIFWAIGLDDVFHNGQDTPFAFAVSVAYPVADLVLLTVALLMLTRARSGQRAMVTVLTVAIGFMAVSDGAFVVLNADAEYVSGNLVDVGWVAGLLLLGCAAMVGARSRHIEFGLARPRRGRRSGCPISRCRWRPCAWSRPRHPPPCWSRRCCWCRRSSSARSSWPTRTARLLVEVADQAFRDTLTGLANRSLFRDRLTHATALQNP